MRQPTIIAILLAGIGAFGLAAESLPIASVVGILPGAGGEADNPGGSGVVIGDGLILTLAEALPATGDAALTVVLAGGRRVDATIERRGTAASAVLLRASGPLPPAVTTGDAAAPALGSTVWTIGNTIGAVVDDGMAAISRGAVSGRYALVPPRPAGSNGPRIGGAVIEIDAAVNDGTQGGAVVDGHGRLIGLATLAQRRERRLGTAIPIDRLLADVGLGPAAATAGAITAPPGQLLVAFDRPRGLGNPEAVPRPDRRPDAVPAYEREALERWWRAYERSLVVLWVDAPAPALVIDAEAGVLLTAASHLHGGSDSGRVVGVDGRRFRVTAIDHPLDLALLTCDGPLPGPVLDLHPRRLEAGAAVSVVAPFASGTVRTSGHVSCVDRRLERGDAGLVQLDARCDYAALGGAVLNGGGALVGLVVRAGPELPWLVGSGVTLAVDGVTLARALPALRAGQSRERLPAIGLGVVLEQADELVVIRTIAPNSGAERAGLAPGDVLLTIDGREISSVMAVTRTLLRHAVGDRVAVELRRGGRPLRTTVVAGIVE